MNLQLYIHFPFCKKKCLYCDFCSHPAEEEEIIRYCRALEKEIEREGKKWRDYEVSTLFIGGGTPSLVPPAAMEGVLRALKRSFRFAGDMEFTSEANPGTIGEEWLRCMMNHGLNRLSLGVQATQDRLLRSLGRIHTFAEARQAFELARRLGIGNINMDLMYALPGQTMADWEETLDVFCGMEPEHISAYSLILEEGTPLYHMAKKGETLIPDDDTAAEMYLIARKKLQTMGYRQYEISNYSREGYRCRHNVGYWQGAWYLGLGVNSSSMLPSLGETENMYVRLKNHPDTDSYIRLVENGQSAVIEQEIITREEAAFEGMMLGLRMNDGVSMEAFERRIGQPMEYFFGEKLERLVRDGLAHFEEGCFRLSERGLLVENEVLVSLMK